MTPPRPSSARNRTTERAWLLGLAVLAFCTIAYAPALHVPFIGDDYVFLDKTRSASFVELWSRANTDFNWYRPWSRESHFWILQKAFGASEPGFRAANLALWLAGLGLYFGFLRRWAGPRVPVLATLGVCSLSLWGAPLTWISGAQDLWILFFALLTLALVDRGQTWLALVSFVGALLSKETAAMLPLVVMAHARWIRRVSWRDALRAMSPLVALTVLWIVFHPTLLGRATHPDEYTVGGDQPLPPISAIALSLLTLFNLDKLTATTEWSAFRPVATVSSALVLAIGVGILTPPRAVETGSSGTQAKRPDLLRFGSVWCLAGWLPLLQPSIGWHGYYGSLGVLGAWLVIGTLLARRPRRTAVILVFALGLLRGWAAAAKTWDWGSEWYQTRAGSMLSLIRSQLLALHPAVPHHSRFYFGNIPNNIGLIAGRSPAVRVWYGDPTLTAGFYSYYRPRAAGEPTAPDYFFHFDSTTGIREVSADGSPPSAAARPDPIWEGDHERLAMTLLSSGDLPRAARLFETIAELPHRADALMFAAACWRRSGDSLRAEADLSRVRARTALSVEAVSDWERKLCEGMPAPRNPRE